MLNLVLSGGWKKKKKKNPTDRPSLKKAVEGNQTFFFFCFIVMHRSWLSNLWPMGCMRPARPYYAARNVIYI